MKKKFNISRFMKRIVAVILAVTVSSTAFFSRVVIVLADGSLDVSSIPSFVFRVFQTGPNDLKSYDQLGGSQSPRILNYLQNFSSFVGTTIPNSTYTTELTSAGATYFRSFVPTASDTYWTTSTTPAQYTSILTPIYKQFYLGGYNLPVTINHEYKLTFKFLTNMKLRQTYNTSSITITIPGRDILNRSFWWKGEAAPQYTGFRDVNNVDHLAADWNITLSAEWKEASTFFSGNPTSDRYLVDVQVTFTPTSSCTIKTFFGIASWIYVTDKVYGVNTQYLLEDPEDYFSSYYLLKVFLTDYGVPSSGGSETTLQELNDVFRDSVETASDMFQSGVNFVSTNLAPAFAFLSSFYSGIVSSNNFFFGYIGVIGSAILFGALIRAFASKKGD